MKQPPFEDEQVLIQAIRERLPQLEPLVSPLVISIDGLGGTGKTTLAAKIAEALGGRVVSLDDHLAPHHGTYLPHLRYAEVGAQLESTQREVTSLVVVEGLYVLSALDHLRITPAISIYIRRVDQYGRWNDEFSYSEENDLQEQMQAIDRRERSPGDDDDDREAVSYHINRKPITNADFVLDRPARLPSPKAASA